MDRGPIRRPCENCGSSNWTYATPGTDKRALMAIELGGERPSFKPTVGIPVDVFVCDTCGTLRLFATARLGRP